MVSTLASGMRCVSWSQILAHPIVYTFSLASVLGSSTTIVHCFFNALGSSLCCMSFSLLSSCHTPGALVINAQDEFEMLVVAEADFVVVFGEEAVELVRELTEAISFDPKDSSFFSKFVSIVLVILLKCSPSYRVSDAISNDAAAYSEPVSSGCKGLVTTMVVVDIGGCLLRTFVNAVARFVAVEACAVLDAPLLCIIIHLIQSVEVHRIATSSSSGRGGLIVVCGVVWLLMSIILGRSVFLDVIELLDVIVEVCGFSTPSFKVLRAWWCLQVA